MGLFYKNVGILLGGCLTVKNWWELVTGDDGVGFRGLFFNHFPSTTKVNILKKVPVVIVG